MPHFVRSPRVALSNVLVSAARKLSADSFPVHDRRTKHRLQFVVRVDMRHRWTYTIPIRGIVGNFLFGRIQATSGRSRGSFISSCAVRGLMVVARGHALPPCSI